MMMADDLDFTMKTPQGGQRRAFRTKVPGLRAVVPAKNLQFDVGDLSATGLSLDSQEGQLREGEGFEFDLFLNNKLFLSGIKARVMRILEGGRAGCNFETMDQRKEERLDKLVLEVQKRLIAMRKAARSREG
jgi:c-di-GMP-binding flagellar brake protein YcgR